MRHPFGSIVTSAAGGVISSGAVDSLSLEEMKIKENDKVIRAKNFSSRPPYFVQ